MAMLRHASEMKDSGIEWMGLIPFNWKLHRIRNNYRIITGNGFKPELQGHDSGKYPVCKASDISSAGSTLSSAANFIDEETAREEHFNIIPANSVIFPKIGEAMKKNNRTRVLVDCCVDNNCQGMVPQLINPVYSYYLLSCIDMRWFDNAGTIPSLNNQKLKDCKIPYPTLTEQQAIASYLDNRCSKIDEIIAEAEKSIEEYKELKQVVIFEAVTKGLDKHVPMKDSGVEWIGEVPSKWSITKLGRYVSILPGYAFSSSDFSKKGIPLLRGVNVTPLGVRWDDTVYWDKPTKGLEQFFLKAEDIVVGLDRPWIKEGTRIFIIKENDLPCLLLQRVCRIRCSKNVLNSFVYYWLSSKSFERALTSETTGISVPHISTNQILGFKMAFPSVSEQLEIVEYLNGRISDIDALISEKQALIEDLKAYKKSLIYEVVTGKRRVV